MTQRDMSSFKASPKLRPLLSDPLKPFIHRDLSWLQFNSRVLAEAELATNPLLERLKFLSISSSNLDEFFMIRMASLGRSIALELRRNNRSQLNRLRRIRAVILKDAARTIENQIRILELLRPEFERHKVQIVTEIKKDSIAFDVGQKLFEERVAPELTPLESFTPTRILQLENQQLAVHFSSGIWVRVSKKLKATLAATDPQSGQTFIFFLDQLLATFSAKILRVEGTPTVLRLTRDADLSVDLEDVKSESIPEIVISSLKLREKGRPVRLQYLGLPQKDFVKRIQETLKVSPQQIFRSTTTTCFHGLWSVIGELPSQITSSPGITYPTFNTHISTQFSEPGNKIFENIRRQDFLLHHPYDSFDAYIKWMEAACRDPFVTTIQQTVYRMDLSSPVVAALKAAAKSKKVRVVIELRARFDERNNLQLAEELRNAGVEVIFGFGKLKIHAKVALVTRIENGEQRLYTHLSTGNYNSVTARHYTDLAILTARQDVGLDAQHFFDSVWKGEIPSLFKVLVPAPTKLHRRILQLIEAEILAAKSGKPARIVGKVNTLVDETVISHLYSASQAGVKIDLIVRGACSLVPGVKGLSENIRVISIVDRFLEHSRIYYFENSKVIYLSSADWMPRNFFSRLELAFPILDENIYRHVEQIVLQTYLADTNKGRELTTEGQWVARQPSGNTEQLRSQFHFEKIARANYKGTPLE